MSVGSGSVDVFFALDLRRGTDGRTLTRLDIFLAVDLERGTNDTVFPGGSSDCGITVELLQLSSTMSDGSGSVDVFFALDLHCGTDGRTLA